MVVLQQALGVVLVSAGYRTERCEQHRGDLLGFVCEVEPVIDDAEQQDGVVDHARGDAELKV